MNDHSADSIYIIGYSDGRATEIKSSVSVRGFDRVKCYPLSSASAVVSEYPPDLVILDPEGHYPEALAFLNRLPHSVPVILLADAFDEETFLTCFDAGAKDFIIKPVTPSYLASRVLIALDVRRLRDQLAQRDVVLRDLSVIGEDSNVFTTEYLVKMLKREVEHLSRENTPPLSLLVVQLEGLLPGLSAHPDFRRRLYREVAGILNRCCRGSDILGEYFEDKFAVILPNTGMDGVASVSQRILKRLDGAVVHWGAETATVSIRIGASGYDGCLHYEDLLNKAMENLKTARQGTQKVHLG